VALLGDVLGFPGTAKTETGHLFEVSPHYLENEINHCVILAQETEQFL
jgi:hypothetical protein